jgi:CheY-like chemotaxis protein
MRTTHQNILIIGLDPDIHHCLSNLCETKGYKVRSVQTGEEGLAVVQGEVFDAVLLEGVQSDMDRDVLLNILIEAYPGLPVIILTASLGVDSKTAKELIQRGAFGVVPMPWDQKKLLLVISEAVRAGTRPFVRPSFEEDTPRIRAQGLIRHFDRVYAKFSKYKYKFGGETAREWLRLIDNRTVAEAEVAALVINVTQGRWRGTGWSALAHEVSKWACSMGFPGVDFKAVPEHLPEEPKENGIQSISGPTHE